ncbi:hypothetical protein [Halonotius sp. GCM10025705]|uniref:hypothetical protein n=1 Tax=Halonotius sp. GCM10025705 TaxID=3252678 RepID=UPI00361C1B43
MSAQAICIGLIDRLFARLRWSSLHAEPPYVAVIREATTCVGATERAAAFQRADGLDRLRSAIDAAEADDRPALAREGRQALLALRRLPPHARGTDIPPRQ